MNLSVAYLAGFFDGEGCVYIQKMKTSSGTDVYQLRVAITQSDTEVLDYVAETYGGCVHFNPPGKSARRDSYRVELNKPGMKKFLQDIRPYTVGKSAQIDLALEFVAHKEKFDMRGKHSHKELLRQVADERHRMYIRMKALKISQEITE